MALVKSALVQDVIGAAIDVHRALGPGLFESAYEICLWQEFADRRIPVVRQLHIPLIYKGREMPCCYRLDFLVNDWLAVELKSVESVLPIHQAQILSYMRLLKVRQGLLFNFNVLRLVDGIKSFLL